MFPKLVLGLAAVLLTGLGVLFAVAPHWTAGTVDIALPTNTATIDFIATYGGFQIGFGIFLFTCLARPERVRLGLLASGYAVAGFGVTRALGLLVLGGAKPVLYGALAFEAVSSTIAFVAARRASRQT